MVGGDEEAGGNEGSRSNAKEHRFVIPAKVFCCNVYLCKHKK